MSLDGKKVVITGGSSGIGFATAQRAVVQGAEVIIVSRSSHKLAHAKRLLSRLQTVVLDVRKEQEMKQFFESFSPFDHLVTAAADAGGGPLFLQRETASARDLFEGKFWGQYVALKYAASKLRQGSSITLFSGWISRKPMTGYSTLAAIDGAVESLTRVLALELAPIRVNAISPGVIDTPLRSAMPEEVRHTTLEAFATRLPVRRVGQAEDVAKAVLYLMDNDFTTGAILDVDGGQQ
jgi:NAD(P)-dependent dehydrogenase (short-subunit alcohol dehydrogenase family)